MAKKPEAEVEFHQDGMARFERGVGLVVKAAAQEKASRKPARIVKKAAAASVVGFFSDSSAVPQEVLLVMRANSLALLTKKALC